MKTKMHSHFLNMFIFTAASFSANALYAVPFVLQGPADKFDEVCYLARYPDVVTGWVNTAGKPAIDHWLQHGKAEGRIPGCSENSKVEFTQNFPATLTIKTEPVEGSAVEITSFLKGLGGAIGSLQWKGLEFLNRVDRGRELQSAISFDDHGECYNPTEAGSRADKDNTSSSKLIRIGYRPSFWEMNSQMAFWLYGDRTGGGCKYGPQVAVALSQHKMNKKINLNYKGDGAVIEYIVSFQNPPGVPKRKGVYELLTGYMTTEFSRVYEIDPLTYQMDEVRSFVPLTGPGFPEGKTQKAIRENPRKPVIASTASGGYTMGVLFPTQEIPGHFEGYDLYKFAGSGGALGKGSNKWNAWVVDETPNQTLREFRVLLVVGSLFEVSAKMKQLIKNEGSQL